MRMLPVLVGYRSSREMGMSKAVRGWTGCVIAGGASLDPNCGLIHVSGSNTYVATPTAARCPTRMQPLVQAAFVSLQCCSELLLNVASPSSQCPSPQRLSSPPYALLATLNPSSACQPSLAPPAAQQIERVPEKQRDCMSGYEGGEKRP